MSFNYKILTNDKSVPPEYRKVCATCNRYCDIVVKLRDERYIIVCCKECGESLLAELEKALEEIQSLE